jgi:hypothetical protein
MKIVAKRLLSRAIIYSLLLLFPLLIWGTTANATPMREFRRVDSDQTTKQKADLLRILSVLGELPGEMKDRHLVVDNYLGPTPSPKISVKGGTIWLKTVIRNLLRNAIQYGEKGGMISIGIEDQGPSYRINVSNSRSASVTITLPPAADTTPPTVTSFSLPATSNSLTVAITTFTATDNVGVTGYLLTESATKPDTSAAG